MRLLILLLFFWLPVVAGAQTDTIRLHFLYGSKPARDYKQSERKVFGGLKGGHVSIESKGHVLDFMPGNNPLFPQNKNPSGGFRLNKGIYWDTAGSKWATVLVPVTSEQLQELDLLFQEYSKETPYDYAIFGMRCAAASYDVLSEIGLVKKISNRKNIATHFYPKLLRKRMLRWAKKNNFPVLYHQGKASRKWEEDKGLL